METAMNSKELSSTRYEATFGRQTTRVSWDNMLPEIWLVIKDFLGSKKEMSSLLRVNKFLYSLLTFERAKYEAEALWSGRRQRHPSMLHVALRRGRPLHEMEEIVAGYLAVCAWPAIHHVEARLHSHWGSHLHLAVLMNRVDVLDLLLESGVQINIKFYGSSFEGCGPFARAHMECIDSETSDCKNALDVARESENANIERYLLLKGIEDLGRDEPIPDWRKPYYIEMYSPCENWWSG